MLDKRPDREFFLRITLISEGAFLLVGTVWCYISGIVLRQAFEPHSREFVYGAVVGIGMSFISTVIYWLSLRLPWQWSSNFGKKINELAEMFSDITVSDVIAMSLASGFCEEVFFRGVLQDQFGLFGASVLFGILHAPGSFQYGFWAFCAGALLGWLYERSHNLWLPITAHVVNNIIGLMFLRHIGRKSATSV